MPLITAHNILTSAKFALLYGVLYVGVFLISDLPFSFLGCAEFFGKAFGAVFCVFMGLFMLINLTGRRR